MEEEKEAGKPLTEQVVDELLSTISKEEEFDDEIIESIRRLAQEGNLKRAEQVINVIKPKKEDKQ